MRLENLLALTHATLKSEPCVSYFENIIFDTNKVNRGDLFVAKDTKLIPDAIKNGAYGILYELDTPILDPEIAWIKTENLEDALIRLLRFRLIEKETVAYACNELVVKLAKEFDVGPNCRVISGDLESLFKSLWHLQNHSILLFSPSLHDERIFAHKKKSPSRAVEKITIMEKTLFETSFIYKNKFYERQLISPFFIPYLEELLNIFTILNIHYTLKKFSHIEHFEPVFTNNSFEIKEFGTSDKVLIFEPNISLVKVEIDYLQNNTTWANTIYIVPKCVDIQKAKDIYFYENKSEVLAILKQTKFNFAFIAGAQKSVLETNKNFSTATQLTLDL